MTNNKRQAWNQEESALLSLYLQKLTYHEIQKSFPNRTIAALTNKVKKLVKKFNFTRPFP
jgi:hypothetical protein